jgi:hypothetical protein
MASPGSPHARLVFQLDRAKMDAVGSAPFASVVIPLAASGPPPHASGMFEVSEAEAAAIRAAYDRGGEFTAAIELRRLFPGIPDNDQARDCARTIAGCKPLRMPRKARPCPTRTRSSTR